MVSISTKRDHDELETSRLSAERRLHTIELRLERNPELKLRYHNFMRKCELGHMDPVNSQERKKMCYCLPHPVFKGKGSKTKLGLHLVEVPSSNGTQQHNKHYHWIM
jgi:hypothetical protein